MKNEEKLRVFSHQMMAYFVEIEIQDVTIELGLWKRHYGHLEHLFEISRLVDLQRSIAGKHQRNKGEFPSNIERQRCGVPCSHLVISPSHTSRKLYLE